MSPATPTPTGITGLPRNWGEIRREWPSLSFYQRFETGVAFVLTLVIGAVVIVALGRVIAKVVDVLVLKALNPLEHTVFQDVFGEIMTLLIALEFNHTLHQQTALRGIIRVRIVLLIALLALARKIILLELYETTAATMAALALLVVSLGLTAALLTHAGARRHVPPEQASGTA